MGDDDSEPILRLSGLKTTFETRQGAVNAVTDVSFDVQPGETVALVGESGCGKSVTALSIVQLLESTGSITAGSVRFSGRELTDYSEAEMRNIRGKEIAMIFQDPATCLDPVYTIENQLTEALSIHNDLSDGEYRKRSLELLEEVGMPDAESRLTSFQHELSGGQRQRVMIAMALACRPQLILADEPTTALDVTVQAQVLDLLRHLRDETGSALVLVTHDLGVVAEMADRVVVMYAGYVVEQGSVRDVLKNPQHPYTKALLGSMPGAVASADERLTAIAGSVPSLFDMPTGCRFHPRCPSAFEPCAEKTPDLLVVNEGHRNRCWLADTDAVVSARIGATT